MMKHRNVMSLIVGLSAALLMSESGVAKTGAEGRSEKEGTAAEVGKPAPDFELKDLEGNVHKLSQFKGKIVVLEWTNHQCPFVVRCHKNRIMATTFERFKDDDVVWLAVNSSQFVEEKAEEIQKWTKEFKVSYPLLLDPTGAVGRRYEAKTTPHMFVIDRNGVLAYAGAIDDDPRGEKEARRNYVEEAISALVQGSAVARATTTPYGCTIKYREQ